MNARAIITHSDRMPTNRDRLNAWCLGDYRQQRDAEMAHTTKSKRQDSEMKPLTANDRAQITAGWARQTARDHRRAQIRRTIDIVSFAIGLAGVCAILCARAMGWL